MQEYKTDLFFYLSIEDGFFFPLKFVYTKYSEGQSIVHSSCDLLASLEKCHFLISMYIAIAVRGRSYNICRPDTCIIHANFIGQVSVLQRMSRNIFSLSVTIKMALCGSQQRNLMWYMFGILFIVLGICSNNIARTVSIGYTCICSTQIFFCMSEKKKFK